jgi:hypothetical protein
MPQMPISAGHKKSKTITYPINKTMLPNRAISELVCKPSAFISLILKVILNNAGKTEKVVNNPKG